MDDESSPGSRRKIDGGGPHGGGSGEQSPLQARAQFFKNWSWELVISLNRGACERGKAQHGFNRETQEAVADEWQGKRSETLSFLEAVDFLRSCHRGAPFLFFNGNTFADIGRRLSAALLAELPPVRLREATSAVAHYVAGVLDREAMIEIVEGLCRVSDFKVGDRVKTLRGSTEGVVIRVMKDGRIVWKPVGAQAELIALPEGLLRV
jgi:hypothetical protein